MNTHPLDFIPPQVVWIDPVDKEMQAVEARLGNAITDQHESLTWATKRLLSAGGKRVRPRLCLLSARIFNTGFPDAVSLAAAIEMLHTATLVHDDLIDSSMLRRGLPTLNADWSPAATVLVGDYLFARSASLVAEANHVRVMRLFADTLMVILNGEVAQRVSKWQIQRQEYYQRIYAKTAALFELAAQAAAVLGNANQFKETALVEYGRSAGMAFQIVDDVLDFTGTVEQTGKPTGSDLRQGLFTLPVIYYHEAQPSDTDISLLLENRGPDDQVIQRVVQKVLESTAIDESLKEARKYVRQAQVALEEFPPSPYVQALTELANSIVNRKS